MNHLVTGGTGFVGAYIVCDLFQQGPQVVIYDLAPNEEGVVGGRYIKTLRQQHGLSKV